MISAYSSRNFRRICQSIVKNLIDLYMYFIFDPGGGGITVNCNHCPTYTESQK